MDGAIMKTNKSAFTLIELLIVVAIIAILAAIAVPNFLEAQTRAKISRARADMRSLTTALETYVLDNNTYLYCNVPSIAIDTRPNRPNSRRTFERLTTPIAYLSGIEAFTDPFAAQKVWDKPWNNADPFGKVTDKDASRIYWYTARNNSPGANARWDELEKKPDGEPKPVWYLIESSGPDSTRHQMSNALNDFGPNDLRLGAAMYDSTNGTVSRGSIWRGGGAPNLATDKVFYNMVQSTY